MFTYITVTLHLANFLERIELRYIPSTKITVRNLRDKDKVFRVKKRTMSKTANLRLRWKKSL